MSLTLQNESLVKPKINLSELQFEKLDNGNYLITARQQKRGQKIHEHEFEFTQNGINALLGPWLAIAESNGD